MKLLESVERQLTNLISWPPIGICLVLTSCVILALTGVVGVGRSGVYSADVIYWYVSGKSWLLGISPYDYESFQEIARTNGIAFIERYAYPPQSFAWSALFSPFTLNGARVLMVVFNTLALAGLCWTSLLCYARNSSFGSLKNLIASRSAIKWLIPCVIIANPFTSSVVWTGQTALVVTSTLALSWLLIEGGRNVVFGALLLAFATIKPQLTILVIFWLVLERDVKTLSYYAIWVCLLACIPIYHFSPIQLLLDWWYSTQGYQLEPTKTHGLSYNTNLSSALTALGMPKLGTATSMALAFVFGGALWVVVRKKLVPRGAALPLLLALSLFFIYGRDYDLAALVATLSIFFSYCERSPGERNVLVILIVTMFIPHRIVELLSFEPLLYWRIYLLLFLIAFLILVSLKVSSRGAKNISGESTI